MLSSGFIPARMPSVARCTGSSWPGRRSIRRSGRDAGQASVSPPPLRAPRQQSPASFPRPDPAPPDVAVGEGAEQLPLARRRVDPGHTRSTRSSGASPASTPSRRAPDRLPPRHHFLSAPSAGSQQHGNPDDQRLCPRHSSLRLPWPCRCPRFRGVERRRGQARRRHWQLRARQTTSNLMRIALPFGAHLAPFAPLLTPCRDRRLLLGVTRIVRTGPLPSQDVTVRSCSVFTAARMCFSRARPRASP
jgi:hypothetical protein